MYMKKVAVSTALFSLLFSLTPVAALAAEEAPAPADAATEAPIPVKEADTPTAIPEKSTEHTTKPTENKETYDQPVTTPPTSTNPGSNEPEEPTEEPEPKPEPTLSVKASVGKETISVTATISHGEEVDGTYVFQMGDKKVEKEAVGTEATAEFAATPGTHKIEVTFVGKIDGEEKTLSDSTTVEVKDTKPPVKPVFAADLVDAGDAVQVVANIKHAEAVEGKWYAILFDAKGREVDAREGGDSSSFTASFSIDALEPGEYTIIVGFLGVVNGEEVDFDEELFFEVVEEDPQPQDPQDPNSPDQGDDGDKGVNIGDDGDDEDSSDKVDNAKGGPLPKTDTAYPVGAMAGAALLSAGLLYTRFRRQA